MGNEGTGLLGRPTHRIKAAHSAEIDMLTETDTDGGLYGVIGAEWCGGRTIEE